MRGTWTIAASAAALVAGWTMACGGGDAGSVGSTLRVERDTVGDTIVVRTLAGSVWGEDAYLVEELRIGRLDGPEEYTFGRISGLDVDVEGNVYVVDAQVPALRKYAPDGTHLMDFGRPGEGPGEIKQTDGGVAVLADGRVLLRDPGNARINVYAPDGEPLDAWRIRGGSFTSTPLVVDTAGAVYHPVFDFQEGGTRYRLVRFAPDGTVEDTLAVPEWDHQAPLLEAVFEQGDNRSMSRRVVPFSPRGFWTFSPLGYFVGGVTDRYAIVLLPPEGPLRIERVVEPVAVQPGEKQNARERTIATLRRTDPGWEWNGPGIPDTKPYYRDLLAGREGRLWVAVSTEGRPVPEDELEVDDAPDAIPPDRWREPLAYDAFEPDGRYLGRVVPGARLQPLVLRGDRVWSVQTDELGVPYVLRHRVVRGAGGLESGP